MFCYILRVAAVDEFFYLRFTFKLSYFFRFFQHGSGSSVNAIMPLSATLPLATDLKIFWFIIALLLYPKSDILGLFRSWRSLPTKPVFEKILTNTFCQYIFNLMPDKKLVSFNDWINAYFQSFICLPRYENFLASIFCKVSLALLSRIHPILERLKEKLWSHENLQSLTYLNGAKIGFRSNSRNCSFWMFMMWKHQSINEKNVLLLQLLVDYMLIELYLQNWERGLQVLLSFLRKVSTWYVVNLKCDSKAWKYHCSTCIEYIYLYQNFIDSVVLISSNVM